MPWEKEFDTEEALGDAMRAFWAKGYEATSMADLTQAMRINKGSLYNAYGGKKDLFIQSLSKYSRDNMQVFLAKLDEMQNPLDSITSLFETIVAESLADDDKRGCFLVNTALELPSHSQDIKDLVSGAFEEMESFLEHWLSKGQAQGSIRPDIDPQETAKSLLAQVIGLRVLARGVFSYDSLNTVKKQALCGLAA